jgi:hypothetical protein
MSCSLATPSTVINAANSGAASVCGATVVKLPLIYLVNRRSGDVQELTIDQYLTLGNDVDDDFLVGSDREIAEQSSLQILQFQQSISYS